jgi:hypothetical protein
MASTQGHTQQHQRLRGRERRKERRAGTHLEAKREAEEEGREPSGPQEDQKRRKKRCCQTEAAPPKTAKPKGMMRLREMGGNFSSVLGALSQTKCAGNPSHSRCNETQESWLEGNW